MKIYNVAFLVFFLFSFAFDQAVTAPQSSVLPGSQQKQKSGKTTAANIIFKSIDGGQTWQDISEGLPANLQEEGFPGNGIFANDSSLYLRAGDELYHRATNSKAPIWEKETFPDKHSSIAPGNNGTFAYNWAGQVLQKIYGANVWSPMYTDLPVKEIRTVFETTGGSIFIGCEKGLFKSTNTDKTWKQVVNSGWVLKLVESNGVLMAISQDGILRSADDGETWDCVLNEGGVGIAVEPIKGGFAAVTANTHLMARTVRASYDDGKTWQPIDAGLKADLRVASIIQFGEYFFCGHPDGIFKSSDKGKTWKLLLPSVDDKVFNLFISGNVIYAVSKSGGC
jgi:photosystem II stability/assembly factor-like uncharacterized protein